MYLFSILFLKFKGNQITCGKDCFDASDCPEGQRCRYAKDTCHMTCEDVPCGKDCFDSSDCLEGQRCRLAKDRCHMTCEDVPQGTGKLQCFLN